MAGLEHGVGLNVCWACWWCQGLAWNGEWGFRAGEWHGMCELMGARGCRPRYWRFGVQWELLWLVRGMVGWVAEKAPVGGGFLVLLRCCGS